MATDDGKAVVHGDGRKCRWTGDGVGDFWGFDDGDRVVICSRPHPALSDRGEFGMPGLGSALPADAFDIRDPNHPDHRGKRIAESRAVITKDALTLEFAAEGLGNRVEAATDDARYILGLIPTILEDFLLNNAKYARAQTGHDLGAKGIIPDLNRKFAVLVSRLWHDEPEAGRDPTDEVISDMIGHLLLLLAKRR